MNFHTRKWVKPEDLNPNGTLFGGSLLRWIDEEAAIYAIVQLGNQRVVTKYISEINFVSASRQGDIIELSGKRDVSLRHVDGPQGVRGRNSDNTRLREVLDWEPGIDLEEGLVPTYRWIEKQAREASPILAS